MLSPFLFLPLYFTSISLFVFDFLDLYPLNTLTSFFILSPYQYLSPYTYITNIFFSLGFYSSLHHLITHHHLFQHHHHYHLPPPPLPALLSHTSPGHMCSCLFLSDLSLPYITLPLISIFPFFLPLCIPSSSLSLLPSFFSLLSISQPPSFFKSFPIFSFFSSLSSQFSTCIIPPSLSPITFSCYSPHHLPHLTSHTTLLRSFPIASLT